MSDKYGYIGIETLLNFCSNDKTHCVTPNDFMRMNRIKIDERPHGEWNTTPNPNYSPFDSTSAVIYMCSQCDYSSGDKIVATWNFCPNCGADMRPKEGEEGEV